MWADAIPHRVCVLAVMPATPRHRLRREDRHRDGSGVDWTPTALALAEAGVGLTIAYYTDWPTSFWITALSGMVFLGATLDTRRIAPDRG